MGCDAVTLPVDTAPSLTLQHDAHNFKCCTALRRRDDDDDGDDGDVFDDLKG